MICTLRNYLCELRVWLWGQMDLGSHLCFATYCPCDFTPQKPQISKDSLLVAPLWGCCDYSSTMTYIKCSAQSRILGSTPLTLPKKGAMRPWFNTSLYLLGLRAISLNELHTFEDMGLVLGFYMYVSE